ncbi:hypothetical protein AVEN_110890-1 [Araneus ventricosus]|uniref:Uncharacterized protein n=1 Tax=Araneus ventricosus TaxID=182803 RepID=A0A4Y2PU62_ARAVE|nr:hypothetical protein AVEN_110890-1 [Araneus ventricosus]
MKGKDTRSKTKEHHPTLPKHPGKQLKDWPPQQIVGHWASCIINPITSISCSNPRFTGVRPVFGSGPKEPPPPLLCHRVDESLLTYTAASPPLTHGVPPDGDARSNKNIPEAASDCINVREIHQS